MLSHNYKCKQFSPDGITFWHFEFLWDLAKFKHVKLPWHKVSQGLTKLLRSNRFELEVMGNIFTAKFVI